MMDWARASGFEGIAAGKGTKYLPEFHTSTPDTVWPYYGFTDEMVAAGDFNAQMFNSFLDGTKSAIEMAAEIGRAHVELQSLMRISYAVFCLTKKTKNRHQDTRYCRMNEEKKASKGTCTTLQNVGRNRSRRRSKIE